MQVSNGRYSCRGESVCIGMSVRKGLEEGCALRATGGEAEAVLKGLFGSLYAQCVALSTAAYS